MAEVVIFCPVPCCCCRYAYGWIPIYGSGSPTKFLRCVAGEVQSSSSSSHQVRVGSVLTRVGDSANTATKSIIEYVCQYCVEVLGEEDYEVHVLEHVSEGRPEAA